MVQPTMLFEHDTGNADRGSVDHGVVETRRRLPLRDGCLARRHHAPGVRQLFVGRAESVVGNGQKP